jgi:hypothetical protein
MSKNIVTVARQISRGVHTAEDHIDQAFSSAARFAADMVDARIHNGLPRLTGETAVQRALEAIQHTVRARDAVLEAHQELASLNLRELNIGDVTDCPKPWTTGQTEVVPISIVQSA